jgi:hypothetical protein
MVGCKVYIAADIKPSFYDDSIAVFPNSYIRIVRSTRSPPTRTSLGDDPVTVFLAGLFIPKMNRLTGRKYGVVQAFLEAIDEAKPIVSFNHRNRRRFP